MEPDFPCLAEPDIPCLADEIAEPRPDMNNKVTAFTVSEKSTNTCAILMNLSVLTLYPIKRL